MMVEFTTILGIGLSIIGIIFTPQISVLLGATEAMLEDCIIYGRIVLAFNLTFMLQNVFQTFLATAEKPKLGLAVTVAAGVTNMVLDALFIAVFHWGVAGAAIATGLSQTVGGVLPLIYFARKNDSLLRLKFTKLEGRALLKACTNGSSELMSNISSSIVSVLYNFQLLKFAGENGVATYGVLMYIQFIFVAIFIGYTIGTSPIIGYHYGAANYDELKNMLRKSMTIMGVGGVIMMILAQVLASPLAKVFVGYDAELYDMTCHAFKIFSFAFIFAGVNIFASSFFTALNNGAVSAAISFLRTLVFQVAAVLILPILFKLDGIWFAITAAEVFALVISMIFLVKKRAEYHY